MTEKKHQEDMTTGEAQCGLYNLDTNQWTELPPIEYEWDRNAVNTFHSKTLFDGNDAVYLYSSGEFEKLNLNQGKWEKTGIKWPYDAGKIWMENECEMRAVCYNQQTVKIYHLDLRQKQKEWKGEAIDFNVRGAALTRIKSQHTQFIW